MNGAVQGVATSTATAPAQKWPQLPSPLDSIVVRPAPISKTPNRFSAISTNSSAIAATKTGDWSWKPQPTDCPSALRTSSSPPRAANDRITPPVKA